MIHRVDTVISALGVPVALVLLLVAVRDHRDGASVLWVWGAVALLLVTVHTLVRDIRRTA
ncbi:hypothetical protein ACTU45_27175 [Streptomyces sp. 24-1644]|uniref:hypothetical protein n=1 Tax=Streptomyces sp. 24-1644 TaxID=3457315 RepID=UPI003FA7D886